jgi:hypothetical protein
MLRLALTIVEAVVAAVVGPSSSTGSRLTKSPLACWVAAERG